MDSKEGDIIKFRADKSNKSISDPYDIMWIYTSVNYSGFRELWQQLKQCDLYDKSELKIIPRSASVLTVGMISPPVANWRLVAPETQCKCCDLE